MPASFYRASVALLALMIAVPTPILAQETKVLPESHEQMQLSFAPLVKRTASAVVNVYAERMVERRSPIFDDPFFQQFFGQQMPNRTEKQSSLGSGVIVESKGIVVTNNHVIEGADDIKVALSDGREYPCDVVLKDDRVDLAVLKIKTGGDYPSLPIGNSDAVEVGDLVLAIGNPFGVGQTVTSGIVSALARNQVVKSEFGFFIQTDASINPGNSGGALVNLRGQLVGVNTMIFSPSGGNVGIGFAIPSNLAAEVMQQLIAHGKVQRGTLGLQTQDITPRIAQLLNLGQDKGVVVTGVNAGSPAEQAGLQSGDVLTSINDKPLRDVNELRNTEGLLPVGSTVKLGVLHDGKPRVASAQLRPEKIASVDGGKLDPRLAGVTFSELGQSERSQGMYGVAVSAVRPNSHAAAGGLKAGDIVIGVGNARITDLRMLNQLAGVRPRQLVLIVADTDGTHYVLIQ